MNWLYDHWLAVLFLSLYTLVLLYTADLGRGRRRDLVFRDLRVNQ